MDPPDLALDSTCACSQTVTTMQCTQQRNLRSAKPLFSRAVAQPAGVALSVLPLCRTENIKLVSVSASLMLSLFSQCCVALAASRSVTLRGSSNALKPANSAVRGSTQGRMVPRAVPGTPRGANSSPNVAAEEPGWSGLVDGSAWVVDDEARRALRAAGT